jgi:hypothetical protein
MFPSAKVAEEAKEVAVWVEDDKLAIAGFLVALSIPALLKRDVDGLRLPSTPVRLFEKTPWFRTIGSTDSWTWI